MDIPALGALLGALLKEITDSMDKAKQYKTILERVEENLEPLVPRIKVIKVYEQMLDQEDSEDIKRLKRIFQEGIDLVHKCKETVHWWNSCCTKPKYAGQLENWQRKLLDFMQTAALLALWMKSLTASKGISRITGSSSVPEEPTFVVGLERHLAELKMRLISDQASICVLSAPEGCGKTTLAKKICHDKDIKSTFKDNIFFIHVSSTPNLKAMVQKIFRHRGYSEVPHFQDDDDAISQLGNLLRSIGSPILLVLDDVSSGSEDLVDRLHMQIPDYKILVTTRFSFPRFPSPYPLTNLDRVDQEKLFRISASSADGGDLCIPDELVDKVIEFCKGLPLALKVVGRSLCGQPEVVWREKLHDWSEGISLTDSTNEILTRLKPSFDMLNDRMKDCFMDLAAFPEDQKIPAPVLIDMWAGLYDKDEGDINAMKKIYDLCQKNLASLLVTSDIWIDGDGDCDNCYHGHYMMQHDLLRELAVHQCNLNEVEVRERLLININRNIYPDWWKEQRDDHIKAHLLSISTDEMFSSNWRRLQAPNVKVIVLNFWRNSYFLPAFIYNMKETKVFIATNYGCSRTVLNNFQVLASLPALERIRLQKVFFPLQRKSSLQLLALQKLTLVMCGIDEEFENFDISNAFPNLAEINIDSCSDLVHLPPSLCNILALRKLRIANCHSLKELPEELGKLTNLEELRLGACTDLEKLPGSFGSLQKLRFLDMSDCLSIYEMPEDIGNLQSLRKLYMIKCLGVDKLPRSTTGLKDLKVICDEERAALWKPFQDRIANLKIEIYKEAHNLNSLL